MPPFRCATRRSGHEGPQGDGIIIQSIPGTAAAETEIAAPTLKEYDDLGENYHEPTPFTETACWAIRHGLDGLGQPVGWRTTQRRR